MTNLNASKHISKYVVTYSKPETNPNVIGPKLFLSCPPDNHHFTYIKHTFIIVLLTESHQDNQGKAKHFIASISQRYTSNWSKATLKRPTTYKRERVTKEKTFKTERNKAVGTTEPLQHTERLRHGSSGGEGSLFDIYIRLLVPPSQGIRAQDL